MSMDRGSKGAAADAGDAIAPIHPPTRNGLLHPAGGSAALDPGSSESGGGGQAASGNEPTKMLVRAACSVCCPSVALRVAAVVAVACQLPY